MSVEKLPKGIRRRGTRYLAEVMVDGKRSSITADTLEEAIRKREELRSSLSSHPIASISEQNKIMTLGSLRDIVVEMVWRGSKSERSTVLNANDVVDYFGEDTPINIITTEKIDEWIKHLEKVRKVGNATINRKISVLSKMLTHAVRTRKLEHLPWINRRREPPGRTRFVSYEEEAVLLAWMERLGYTNQRDAIILMLDTGLRCGEVIKQLGRDVDLTFGEHGVLVVHDTKNGDSRVVPLSERCKEIMERRISVFGTGRLFPYQDWWLRLPWDKVKELMGLKDDPGFIPHILRHTCATRLALAEVNAFTIQQWMGHKTITTTNRYTHIVASHLLGAAAALDRRNKAA